MKELRFNRTPHCVGYGYELRMFDRNVPNFTASYAESIVMKEITVEGIIIPPIMTLTKEEVQECMDELWALGIRPSDGEGSIGAIGAIKYHLEDMRKLVFKPEGPKV